MSPRRTSPAKSPPRSSTRPSSPASRRASSPPARKQCGDSLMVPSGSGGSVRRGTAGAIATAKGRGGAPVRGGKEDRPQFGGGAAAQGTAQERVRAAAKRDPEVDRDDAEAGGLAVFDLAPRRQEHPCVAQQRNPRVGVGAALRCVAALARRRSRGGRRGPGLGMVHGGDYSSFRTLPQAACPETGVVVACNPKCPYPGGIYSDRGQKRA